MHRLEKAQARVKTSDRRDERRARTRHLIELGGLVAKAGLVELTGDDRAKILGGLLGLADQLRGFDPRSARGAELRALWGDRGRRAFAADTTGKRMSRAVQQEGPTAERASGKKETMIGRSSPGQK
jgi:Conjugal transfer protein TraD